MPKQLYTAHQSEKGASRPQISKNTFARALGYLKPYRKILVLVTFCIILQVLGNVGGTYLLQPIIAGIYNEGNPTFLGIEFTDKSVFLLSLLPMR